METTWLAGIIQAINPLLHYTKCEVSFNAGMTEVNIFTYWRNRPSCTNQPQVQCSQVTKTQEQDLNLSHGTTEFNVGNHCGGLQFQQRWNLPKTQIITKANAGSLVRDPHGTTGAALWLVCGAGERERVSVCWA